MAGSLPPWGCSNGVLVNEMVLGCAPAGGLARCVTNARLTVSTTASATKPPKRLDAFVILASFLFFILCLSRSRDRRGVCRMLDGGRQVLSRRHHPACWVSLCQTTN